MKDVIIIGFSNPTSEGVTLHVNRETSLKPGNLLGKDFWLSWDKIGKALFYEYTEAETVKELNKLRNVNGRDLLTNKI